jgi:hypothetical protein
MEGDETTNNHKEKHPLRLPGLKGLLGVDGWFSNLPFLLFLAALAIFYIWNGHDAEKKKKEVDQLRERLVELNWEFTTTRSELNNKSKQSEVSVMVEPLGLEELTVPPHKIVIKDEGR